MVDLSIKSAVIFLLSSLGPALQSKMCSSKRVCRGVCVFHPNFWGDGIVLQRLVLGISEHLNQAFRGCIWFRCSCYSFVSAQVRDIRTDGRTDGRLANIKPTLCALRIAVGLKMNKNCAYPYSYPNLTGEGHTSISN